MALFCILTGSLALSCSEPHEAAITPRAEVIDLARGAVSLASLRYLNGTYGASCQDRTGPWSLALSASPGPMDFPALEILTNNGACQLSVTSLVADAIYTAIPELPAGPAFGVAPSAFSAAGVTSTAAGSGTAAFADGTGAAASFNTLSGLALDAAGNVLVADTNNHRVRKVTPTGVVTTLAGAGTAGFLDGPAATARFRNPRDLAVDAAGNVYVSDTNNHRIRKVTPAGVVSTLAGSGTAGFADGTGAAASFNAPRGLAWDGAGDLLVADSTNHRIRKVTPAGVVTTVAGSGTQGLVNGAAATARFRSPQGVAVTAAGDIVVADTNNHCLRLISGGTVTTLAGSGTAGYLDGAAATARFRNPADVVVDSGGNLFVADQGNHRVRKVASGVVSTLAGSGTAAFADGTGTAASFSNPTGLVDDGAGNVFVADAANHRLRRTTSGLTTAFFGNARFDAVTGVLSLLVSADPESSSAVSTGSYSTTTGVSSSGLVAPPDYTHSVDGLAIQYDASKIVTTVSGTLALTDGSVTGSSYVIDPGTLPASPSFNACNAAYGAGSATSIAGANPAIPLTSFLPVGTSLSSPVIRTLLIRREVSGVAAFQTIRITFPSP